MVTLNVIILNLDREIKTWHHCCKSWDRRVRARCIEKTAPVIYNRHRCRIVVSLQLTGKSRLTYQSEWSLLMMWLGGCKVTNLLNTTRHHRLPRGAWDSGPRCTSDECNAWRCSVIMNLTRIYFFTVRDTGYAPLGMRITIFQTRDHNEKVKEKQPLLSGPSHDTL